MCSIRTRHKNTSRGVFVGAATEGRPYSCFRDQTQTMRSFLVLPILLLFQHLALAQLRSVNTLIQREMRERRIPGLQVAVVKDGKIVLGKSFGTADIEHSLPVTNKTVFP